MDDETPWAKVLGNVAAVELDAGGGAAAELGPPPLEPWRH